MKRNAAELAEVAALVENGALKPRMEQTMSLSEARNAQELSELRREGSALGWMPSHTMIKRLPCSFSRVPFPSKPTSKNIRGGLLGSTPCGRPQRFSSTARARNARGWRAICPARISSLFWREVSAGSPSGTRKINAEGWYADVVTHLVIPFCTGCIVLAGSCPLQAAE